MKCIICNKEVIPHDVKAWNENVECKACNPERWEKRHKLYIQAIKVLVEGYDAS